MTRCISMLYVLKATIVSLKILPAHSLRSRPSVLLSRLILSTSVMMFACSLSASNINTTSDSASNIGRPLIGNSGKKVSPDYQISFPKDHGEHPEYDIEWWYLTANLEDKNNVPYALQWTLFRFRTPQAENAWDNGQVYMAHASIHAGDKHYFSERFGKGDVGNTGVTSSPLNLFMDDWQWQAKDRALFPASLHFSAELVDAKAAQKLQSTPNVENVRQNNTSVAIANLELVSAAEFILHGDQGYSIKSGNAQHASYYYSQPFIELNGTLTIDGSDIDVSGNAWFDHEWTSQLIDQQTAGWDWFSIHLDNGNKLMAFVMRLNDQDDYVTGTYITADGVSQTLLPTDLTLRVSKMAKINDKNIPVEWHIQVPAIGIALTTKVTKKDQFNPSRFEYYEGSISVDGTHKGRGFMELTGY